MRMGYDQNESKVCLPRQKKEGKNGTKTIPTLPNMANNNNGNIPDNNVSNTKPTNRLQPHETRMIEPDPNFNKWDIILSVLFILFLIGGLYFIIRYAPGVFVWH